MKFIIALLMICGLQANAKNHGDMKPSAEDRAAMATMHEAIATCLKSDKEMPECMEAMKKTCEEKLGAEKCKKMHKNRMHMMMMKGHGKGYSCDKKNCEHGCDKKNCDHANEGTEEKSQ